MFVLTRSQTINERFLIFINDLLANGDIPDLFVVDEIDEVFAATMCLLAGIMPSVVVQKSGKMKDTSWDAAKKQLMSHIKYYMVYLKEIKTHIGNNTINHNNFKEIRRYIDNDYFNVETIKVKNQVAAGICSCVLNIVTYYDIIVTVEPN